MAKRNNNFKSKKLQAPKPYDVSNSFVKKVASRVTELLPQSIWPTKWFSSVNDIDPQNNGRKNLNSPLISEKCDDADQNPTPAKRARIPLNLSYSDPFFSASTVASGYGTRKLRHPLPTNSEIDDGECVPGPSGIQPQYSIRNLESLDSKSRDSYCFNAKKLEVNGEDHSDSSESTSGCSSLPQGEHNTELRNTNQSQTSEHQSNGPESVTRTSLKRRYTDTANYSSMAIHSSRLFSGFGNYSPPNRVAPVPVGRRRNPSFNPDAFGPQNWSGEKTNIKDRIVNSPFYSGKTTYGGVSAYQRNLSRTENQSQYLRGGQRSIQIRPVNTSEARGSASGMSNTARRILEALEMFSSPIQDAKKIPLDGSVNIKRRKVLANSDQSSMHSSRSSALMTQDIPSYMSYHEDFAPPVRELVVPTVPDILAIRRRQRLQGSTVAAREVANETSMLPVIDEKDSKYDSFPRSYPDIRSSGRSGGKIKSKEEINEEPSEEPDLPNIALPITSLPKFDFILPPACPPSYSSKQINSSIFKFSSPIAFSSASETLVSTNSFTFSSPLKATSKERFDNKGTKTCLDSATKSIIRPLETKMTNKGSSYIEKSISNEEKVKNLGGDSSENKIELKSCEGVGLRNMVQDNCRNLQFSSGSNLSEKDTFGDLFKPALGSWECETCMVRNNSDASKCVACETLKSSSSNSESVNAVKTFAEAKSGFGDRFKPPSGSWSCDVCMIQNPSVESNCQACKTPRSTGVIASSSSENNKIGNGTIDKNGFGDKFRKSEGAWDCTICLVRNKAGGPPKCVACEAPQPGTEATDAASVSVSSAKFSLGNIGTSGFYFGIDKAGEIPKKDCSAEAKPTFTFGNTSSAGPGGFIFGEKSGGSKVSAFTLGTSATSESTESDPSKKFALPQNPPKFTFGAKEVYEKTSPSELNKVQSESRSGDDVAKTSEMKVSKEPEYKLGVGVATPLSSVIGVSASSKSSMVVDLKPQFILSSTDEEKDTMPNNCFLFGSCPTTLVKIEDEKASGAAFSSPSSSANHPSTFGMTTTSTGWNSNPVFKIDSTKAPLFPPTTTSTLSTITKLDNRHDELKAGPSTFKFGDATKADSTNNKSQEMAKTSSSNFKFQEPHKTSSIFAVEDKVKATSTATHLPPSTVTSSAFSCGVFTGLSNDKTTAPCEEPNSAAIILPTAADDSSLSNVIKTSNAGQVFMFGSGSSSPATAFNLIGQKQSTQTATTDESVKPFASAGATSNVFGNVSSSKAPVFGSSSPSPAATSLPAAASETRNVTNTGFASPSSNPIFGSPASTSATSSSTVTTVTTVSTTSSTFGSSIFGTAAGSFPGVGSSTPTFGSSTSTPLAAPPAFGIAPSSSTVFGMNSTPSSAPFSFSGGSKPSSEEHHPSQPTNVPFVFGSRTAPSAQHFTFNAAPSKPAFSFGSPAVGQQPVVGTSSSAPAPGTTPALGGFSFGDASKGTTPFGPAQPATSITGGTSNPFGSSSTVPVANITPAASSFGAPLGETNAAASGTFGAPTFNFGSSQSNPTFSFNNNQPGSVPANISQAAAFNFGQTSQPSAASQPVTFNPNMPPSFNFTGGATPQFTATPGALNTASAANPMQRKFKKAVRRSQQPR